jgi:hypothetical protein
MRRATVRGRRTDIDGRRLVNVVCPVCDHRHWIPDAGTGECSRRPGSFTVRSENHRLRSTQSHETPAARHDGAPMKYRPQRTERDITAGGAMPSRKRTTTTPRIIINRTDVRHSGA